VIAAKCVALFADVQQIRRTCNHLTRIAGDRAQVLVDRAELMVGHVPKKRPSHDLQQIAVEGWRETIGRSAGACATWMYVIEIGAFPHDLDELLVGVASGRQPRFVRCQIARVKVRNLRRCPERAKISPST
jgi:hypothetical protein